MKKHSQIAIILILALFSFLLQHCASQKAPSGGPQDKTAPKIISTFPPPDSTNIATLSEILIEFDEAVDRSSIRDQIWMLPEPENPLEFKWKGNKKLRILLKDSLEQNQTYLMTLGTGIKDYRNNKLPAPFILPFSSGARIDKGEISGRVTAEDLEGIFIFAYAKDDSFSARTVFEKKPRYYTQTDKEGRFRIQYLRPDDYRVYAIRDVNRDRRYTFGVDWIGIPTDDVSLDSMKSAFPDLNISLMLEDTTAAKVLRARPTNQQILEIIISEPLSAEQNFNVSIQDTLNQTPLQVLGSELSLEDPTRLLVYTKPQEKIPYEGHLEAASDLSGNLSEKENLVFRFSGSDKKDTTAFRLLNSQPHKDQNTVAYDARIITQFSLPVDSTAFKNAVRLRWRDSLDVAGKWQFHSLSRPVFIPDSAFLRGERYGFYLDSLQLKSLFQQTSSDSIFDYPFKTWDYENLGEIGGTITATDSLWKQVILTATATKGDKKYEIITPIGQPYEIPFLPEGGYFLKTIIDLDQNGKYSPGSSFPFQFAEPYQQYGDTVNVRKRWTTDGINFKFK